MRLRQKQKSKAFIFTIDAIISLVVVIGLSNALVLLNNTHVDLNKVLLYQQAQDVMEVCSQLGRPDDSCFDPLLEKLNSALHRCEKGGVMIKRNYLKGIELRVCI